MRFLAHASQVPYPRPMSTALDLLAAHWLPALIALLGWALAAVFWVREAGLQEALAALRQAHAQAQQERASVDQALERARSEAAYRSRRIDELEDRLERRPHLLGLDSPALSAAEARIRDLQAALLKAQAAQGHAQASAQDAERRRRNATATAERRRRKIERLASESEP